MTIDKRARPEGDDRNQQYQFDAISRQLFYRLRTGVYDIPNRHYAENSEGKEGK